MNILTPPPTRTAPAALTPTHFDGSDEQPKISPNKKVCNVRMWRKPKGMPKRPLSAYNIFFAEERKALLAVDSTKKIGFANLARTVAARWKLLTITDKQPFALKAGEEQMRYKLELKEWRRLGLDPRTKKVKSKTATIKKVNQVDQANLVEEPMEIDAISESDSKMIFDLAERIFGETLELPADVSDNTEPYAVNVLLSCYENSDIPLATDEKLGSRNAQDEYNKLMSRLFQKLNSELDDDEIRFLKATFA